MGRQKTIPKKKNKQDEDWSFSPTGNYIPVFRKKRRKFKKPSVILHVLFPNTQNKDYFLGEILVGHTKNVFPKAFTKCSVSFNSLTEEDEQESLILNYDESSVIVHLLTVDSAFLKELILTKTFAIDFKLTEEKVSIEIYLSSLPLAKFYPKIGNCIKTLFGLLYNITETATVTKTNRNTHSNSEIVDLYRDIAKVRENELKIPNIDVQHCRLKPTLRTYQQNAVRWMIYREKLLEVENDKFHPLYTKINLKSGLSIYYDKYTGYISETKPSVPLSSKGGILADEMGLGKTVEVLASILLHKKPKTDNEHENLSESSCDEDDLHKSPVINRQSKKRKIKEDDNADDVYHPKKTKVPPDFVKTSSKKSATWLALENIYNQSLDQFCTTLNKKKAEECRVQCICGATSENDIIECQCCGKYQHKSCLGYKRNLGKYLCPQCWLDEPLIESGATLIVTPMSLRAQWCKEICKHVKGGLKVLVYDGYCATPVYPAQLKAYDLVITTYNVLQSELRLTESGQAKNLRSQRKYSPPGSPLIRIKWWRLCLDEAQTVETPGRMVSAMAGKICATFRWAVTGTPISKEISDLYGLVDYLQITPYNDPETWKYVLYYPYINGNKNPMYEFLSNILWRTSKEDVLDQINIPKQTFKEHLLQFSAVEKYFYKREHELSCNDFLAKAQKYDPNLMLERMDRSTLKKLLFPLFTLRQACTHPNTIRGRYLATKKQVSSMKDLLDALILKNTSDSEESLRLVISSLNGLAGIYLLLKIPQQAITEYRKVLQLAARFQDEKSREAKLTVDKLQLIHTMHNLADVLDQVTPLQPTLRDDTLRQDCLDVEQKYIQKFIKETVSAYDSSSKAIDVVKYLQEKSVLNAGQWYIDGFEWTYLNKLENDLLGKINTASDIANIASKVLRNDKRYLLKMIYDWDDQIRSLRINVFHSIDRIYEHRPGSEYEIVIKKDLVLKAMDCHLRPQKKNTSKAKCYLCLANAELKNYEGKLFNMQQRKGIKDQETMSLVGSWKPTLEEIILKSLVALLKGKNADVEIVKDGETFISLIEALKKEFKEIRKLWTFLDQQICAQDELDICKIRLQLKNPEEKEEKELKKSKIIKNLNYVLENKLENVNLVSEHELDYQRSLLLNEETRNMMKLEKLLGTQSYLDTLRKQQYEGQSPDPCPICKNALEHHWSILLCGHSYCLECIQILLEKTCGAFIQCSVCRNKQQVQEISYIKAGNTVTNEDDSKIKGNYSTKIEAVLKLLMELREENEDVKVLIFSYWNTVLKCVKKALEENNVIVEMALSGNVEKPVENFKDALKGVTVLLLPISAGSKGLNLIEATHVILVEPLLNPADELQAIGRVHRIGQTKPTIVHKFLIKHTIEESIHQATTSNAENWDKSKVSLKHLTDLFVNNVVRDHFENGETVVTENDDMEVAETSQSETVTV